MGGVVVVSAVRCRTRGPRPPRDAADPALSGPAAPCRRSHVTDRRPRPFSRGDPPFELERRDIRDDGYFPVRRDASTPLLTLGRIRPLHEGEPLADDLDPVICSCPQARSMYGEVPPSQD